MLMSYLRSFFFSIILSIKHNFHFILWIKMKTMEHRDEAIKLLD